MEIKKRRRWFQFHLSTMLAVVLVASMLVWLNLRPKWLGASQPQMITSYAYIQHGWPEMLFQEVHTIDSRDIPWERTDENVPPDTSNLAIQKETFRRGLSQARIYFYKPGVVIDALVALGILAATVFLSERFTRRTTSRSQ